MRPLQPAESVMVWYATRAKRKGGVVPADVMPLHGRKGLVATVPGRGSGPRNYGVLIDGVEVVVPRGNLVPRAAWSRYGNGQ